MNRHRKHDLFSVEDDDGIKRLVLSCWEPGIGAPRLREDVSDREQLELALIHIGASVPTIRSEKSVCVNDNTGANIDIFVVTVPVTPGNLHAILAAGYTPDAEARLCLASLLPPASVMEQLTVNFLQIVEDERKKRMEDRFPLAANKYGTQGAQPTEPPPPRYWRFLSTRAKMCMGALWGNK